MDLKHPLNLYRIHKLAVEKFMKFNVNKNK
jgi:hypothetical protein